MLLGASNLTFGLRAAADAARAKLGGPVDVLAACGKGRSYALRSCFVVRTLPGIDSCGLWRALEAAGERPTFAVVTDLGNDLAFGASAEQVAGWLDGVLARLAGHGARTVLTGLPLASLRRIGPIEFTFWKHLFFPTRRVDRARLLEQAPELDARVAELARRYGLPKVDPEPDWYGLDPIHVRRGRRAEAWSAFVARWSDAPPNGAAPAKLRGSLWYEQVRLFGLETGRAQPCAALADGTTFSLY